MANTNETSTRVVISVLVTFHLAVTLWHGQAHNVLNIGLSPAKNVFVLVVILIAPVVSGFLIWTRHAMAGLWIFCISNLGALVFGVYHHYILVSPDNIGHLPNGDAAAHSRFICTAATLALVELISSLYGAFCIGVQFGKKS